MKIITAFLIITLFFLSSNNVLAQIGLTRQTNNTHGAIAKASSSDNLNILIPNIINLFFTIGGVAFIIMILWGAVNWILSGGDKEKIAGARKRITTAIIGLVLLSSTFVITLVLGQILGLNTLMSGNFYFKGLLTP